MRHAFALIAFIPLACSSSSSPAAASTTDAGGTSGAGGATPAGGSAGTTSTGGVADSYDFDGLNGCKESDFVDGTGDPIDRLVLFGAGPEHVYVPRCLNIRVGSKVQLMGDFSTYPLSPGSSPEMQDTGSPENPITPTSSGKSQTFTFPTAGSFPYVCTAYLDSGMMGVVRVH